MASTREISTVGIMFGPLPGADSRSFPALGSIPWEWHGEACADVPEELADWLAVAYDPRSYMYGEEDRRAMDVTNWDAVRGTVDAYAVGTDPVDVPEVGRMSLMVGMTVEAALARRVAEALEVGAAQFGRILAIAPARDLEEEFLEDGSQDPAYPTAEARNDLVDEMLRMRDALEDYPLLDEDAYSSLEWEAWQEYAPTALRDELRDAVREERMSDETADALEEVGLDLLGILAGGLHYNDGFSGDYGPPFLEILEEMAERSKVLAPVGQMRFEVGTVENYQDHESRRLRDLLERIGVDVDDVAP